MLMCVMLALVSFLMVLIVSIILSNSAVLLLYAVSITVTFTGKSINALPFSLLILDASTCGARKASCGTAIGCGCKRAMHVKFSSPGIPHPQCFSVSDCAALFFYFSK